MAQQLAVKWTKQVELNLFIRSAPHPWSSLSLLWFAILLLLSSMPDAGMVSHHKRPLPIKNISAWILDIGGRLPYAYSGFSF